MRAHRRRERAILKERQLARGDVDLAADRGLGVEDREALGLDDLEVGLGEVAPAPIERELAIASMAREQDARVAQPADLAYDVRGRRRVVGQRLQADDVQAPARREVAAEALERELLRERREAVDRALREREKGLSFIPRPRREKPSVAPMR